MLRQLTTQSSQNTQVIVDAAAALTAQTFSSVDDAIASVLDVISKLMRSRTLFVARFDNLDPVGRVLNVLTVHNSEGGSNVELGVGGPVEQTYCNTVWKTGKPLLVEDSRHHPFYSQLETTRKQNIGSYIGVPLLYGDGSVYGTLCGLDPEPIQMSSNPELVDLLQILARLLISYIEREELNVELKKQRDLTHALLQSEKAARADAEAATIMRGKVSAIVAHGLREPVDTIQQATNRLIDGSASDPQALLAMVRAEAGKMTDLINQVYDLTQMETGLFNVKPEIETPAAFIDAARPQLDALAAQHRLVIDLPADLPSVWADRPRIIQVLTILVGNSAKFSPVGTAITVSASLQGEDVEIAIADEGPGIPPDRIDSMFTVFQDLEQQKLQGVHSVEMDLSVCKGIVEAHGGQIRGENRSSGGALIAFTLLVA